MAQIIKPFTPAPSSPSQSTVAELTNGTFVMTWPDGSGTGIDAQFFDANGNSLGDPFILSSTTTTNPGNPEVTALADGGFFVSFTDFNTFTQFGARFDSTGSPVANTVHADGSPFQMQPNAMLTSAQVPVAISPSGVTLLGYTNASASGSKIDAHIVFGTIDGTVGTDVHITPPTGDQQLSHTNAPSVDILTNGNFVVAFNEAGVDQNLNDYSEHYAQIYDANAT